MEVCSVIGEFMFSFLFYKNVAFTYLNSILSVNEGPLGKLVNVHAFLCLEIKFLVKRYREQKTGLSF